MEEKRSRQEEYVRQVLDAYCRTPGTTGNVGGPDRHLAAQLYQRDVPLTAVENALVLAAARRLLRPANAAPLAAVRSLAYFVPVIDEVLERKVSQDYFQYLRGKIARLSSKASSDPPTSL